ncbi:MAG: hypothetical protein JHC73_18515 [Dolichospermum sp.]|jgi:hypothetical protein|nr:hypothetical protein [Dolichospermum sp.]
MNLNRFIKAVAATAGVAFAFSIGIGSIPSALAIPRPLLNGILNAIPPSLPKSTYSDSYLDGYCKNKYSDLTTAEWAWINGKTLVMVDGSWSCVENPPNTQGNNRPGQVNKYSINMRSVCMEKEGTGIYDYRDQRDPNSWYCGKDKLPQD